MPHHTLLLTIPVSRVINAYIQHLKLSCVYVWVGVWVGVWVYVYAVGDQQGLPGRLAVLPLRLCVCV
jgi:hypothetical protein